MWFDPADRNRFAFSRGKKIEFCIYAKRWRAKTKIMIYTTAERKSSGKSSRQWDKTKEIEAVRFNKRAREGVKKRAEIASPVKS